MQHSHELDLPRQEADSDLDPMDEAIIDLLASFYTHAEIAERLGICTKTIQRRLKDPSFKALMIERRRAALAESTTQMVALNRDAVNTLAALIGSDNESIQLRAAIHVLTNSRQLHQQAVIEDEFEERLSRLERGFDLEGLEPWE